MENKQEESKELRLDSLQQNLKNSEGEFEHLTTVIKTQEDMLERGYKRRDMRVRMHEIAMSDYHPASVGYTFMNNPEWIDLRRELSNMEHEDWLARMDNDIESAEERLKGFKEQADSLAESIKDIKQKIKELKAEK